MALAAILSAFRQLVLDGIELPPTQDERAALYSKNFRGFHLKRSKISLRWTLLGLRSTQAACLWPRVASSALHFPNVGYS